MKRRGVWHKLWGKCSRCGFDYPLDMLTPQLGLLVCSLNACVDNLDTIYRPSIIAAKLAEPKEADSALAQIGHLQEPGELEL
jgi:hypothetical protein